MKKLFNALFYVFMPWPLYVFLSYHFFGAAVRQILSAGAIAIGILSGILAVIWNWKSYKENNRKVYPIVFSILFFGYLLSIILVNLP